MEEIIILGATIDVSTTFKLVVTIIRLILATCVLTCIIYLEIKSIIRDIEDIKYEKIYRQRIKRRKLAIKDSDILMISKFALTIYTIRENYEESYKRKSIIDNKEKAIYEILSKYTKEKDGQDRIYGAFLFCLYPDCTRDVKNYISRVKNRLRELGYEK